MQFDPKEIVGHIACVEAGDETKPEGVFTSKHNEKTAYMFRFDQACTEFFILKDDLSLHSIKYSAFNQ